MLFSFSARGRSFCYLIRAATQPHAFVRAFLVGTGLLVFWGIAPVSGARASAVPPTRLVGRPTDGRSPYDRTIGSILRDAMNPTNVCGRATLKSDHSFVFFPYSGRYSALREIELQFVDPRIRNRFLQTYFRSLSGAEVLNKSLNCCLDIVIPRTANQLLSYNPATGRYRGKVHWGSCVYITSGISVGNGNHINERGDMVSAASYLPLSP